MVTKPGGEKISVWWFKRCTKAVTMDNFKVIKKRVSMNTQQILLLLGYDRIKLHHYYTLKIVCKAFSMNDVTWVN